MSEELLQKKKDNRKLFMKTASAYFFSHLGGLLIANIFCFGLASFLADGMFYIMIPVILIVYSYPLYGTMWNAGHRDLNSAQFGHSKLNRLRGVYYGLAGLAPTIIISIGFVLSKFGLLFNFVIPYKMINAEIWPIINMFTPSMYLPDFEVWQVFVIALLSVLVPIVIGEFAYIMGTFDISIKQKLVYKNTKEDPRTR